MPITGPPTASLLHRVLGDQFLTDVQEDNGEQITLRVLNGAVRERVSYEKKGQTASVGLSSAQVKTALELTTADMIHFEEIVSQIVAGTLEWADIYAVIGLGASRNRRSEFTGATRMFYTESRVKSRLGLS